MDNTKDNELSVDIEERVKHSDNHLIVGLDSVVHYFTVQHSVTWKDSLTGLATKLSDGRKPRCKVAFITNLSWAISSPHRKRDFPILDLITPILYNMGSLIWGRTPN